jgi:hypothetical protein
MTLVNRQIIFKEDAKSEIDDVQDEDNELDELNKDLEKL